MSAKQPRRPGNLVPCAKQHCEGPASHQFSFDYQSMTVFLADYDGDLPYGAQALCVRHADSFTIPNGWQLEDMRRHERPMFVQTAESSGPRRDEDHPAMRARKGLQVRRRADLPGGAVPSEDHPSGPLDIDDRSEPSDITRQIERLARDLAGVGADPRSTTEATGEGTGVSEAPGEGEAAEDVDVESEGVDIDLSDKAVEGIADGIVDYWDEDSTFGDEIDGEGTDVIAVPALVEGPGAPEEDTRVEPSV